MTHYWILTLQHSQTYVLLARLDVWLVCESKESFIANSFRPRSEFCYASVLRAVWYIYLNTCFQFLNNITHIFMQFFTHMYFKKIQTTLLK